MTAALPLALRRMGGLSVPDLARALAARSFQYAPRILKYCVYLLFLLQIRSWPLLWHFVVWRPVFALRGRYLLHRLSHIFSSPAVRRQKNMEWLEDLSNVGMNPFDLQVVYKTWAGPDDCDFNLHLSNSSYPKRLDAARFKFALKSLPTFFRTGGWMGLGATHFTFLREIPMFSPYEIRVSLMSWDHKWIYVVTRFVTKPKKGKGKKAHLKPLISVTPPADAAPRASLHTANGVTTGVSGTSTPFPPRSSTPSPPNGHTNGHANGHANGNGNGHAPDAHLKAVAAQLLERPEPDGAVINCLAISEVCCKIGRLTIPPAVVLPVDGFSCGPSASASASASARPYSHANPPPHWDRVRALRGDAHTALDDSVKKGSLKALRDFFTSGWRDVPDAERWWEPALGAEVEERRLRGLACMQALRKGMEEARTI
ncbi:hypothetical protein C8Q80DRAFT_1232236 [Daedaleopsis nitida]|nr:hypothetical protein C8Q80DRAFT_1232236 [Daedaleopsis nitida]